MELYKGLPLKTIEVNGNEYGVTTESVDFLINHYFNYTNIIDKVIEEFDTSYAYSVPEHIFGADEKTIISYITYLQYYE